MKLFSVLIFGIASLSGIGGLPVAGSTTTSSVSSSPPHAQDGHIELKANVTFPGWFSKKSDADQNSVQEAVEIILDLAATKLFGNEKSVAITVSKWKGYPRKSTSQRVQYYPFTVTFSKDDQSLPLETGTYKGRFKAHDFDRGFEKWKYFAVYGNLVSPTGNLVVDVQSGKIAVQKTSYIGVDHDPNGETAASKTSNRKGNNVHFNLNPVSGTRTVQTVQSSVQ
ncbi:hypothetical protein F5879DRAFT_969371 [Lentinula edodes]|uniref:Uncharacterized protein n=1 Tax=Lentinula edodes TaxID=5353 RepID=A0A1Q3EIN0_LENED|nr:uncharacterized protein C8R40DRAFT_1070496 [Lentinula edodes]KAH7873997.1 hypothetical protein C8R40DRAFT_1070496 [Lentinula edodes]KAJ3901194.1 hypothetical protein F5879DRAFT_969371 [Lentinula edodes]GAW06994.1 hypothetical protein LENED_008953 [Lentinula edodes]